MNETHADQQRESTAAIAVPDQWIIQPEPTAEELAALATVLLLIQQRMASAAPSVRDMDRATTAWQRAARQEALAGANTFAGRSVCFVSGLRPA